MLKEVFGYKKYKEYFSKKFENIFGYIGTIVITTVSIIARIDECFDAYIGLVNSLIGVIIGSYIGALALVLAGIIFWGSFFDGKYINWICSAAEDENAVDKLYSSYWFLAFNMICYIVLAICSLFLINSFLPTVCVPIFYLVELLMVYFFLFNIGYMVSIVGNCIQLIQLKNIEERQEEKTVYERANELRIDIIYELLYRNMSSEDMHDDLMNIINRRIDMMEIDIGEKEKLRTYLEDYYKLVE